MVRMHITKQRSMLFLLTLSKQIDHCKVYSLISKSRTGLSSTFSTSAIFQQETDVNPGDSVYGKTSKPIKLRRMDLSPWAPENNRADPNRGRSKNRYRQHVNPLSRKFQVPTELAEEWPNDGTFTDPFLPLHIGKTRQPSGACFTFDSALLFDICSLTSYHYFFYRSIKRYRVW